MDLAVEALDVTKRFGSTNALSGVRLSVARGSVHALVGRNGAGKSTLVSILTGLVAPDAGNVRFEGESAPPINDRDAWRRRAACVYQHSMIVPHLSVAENIFLNRQPVRGGAIDWRSLYRQTRELLDEWRLEIDERAPGSSLRVEECQLVEIVRALAFGARFVILDEPTARLEGTAIARLFANLRALNATGVTILFISHHLQEIYELCDSVTVLRDGRTVLESRVAGVSNAQLIAAMSGETPESLAAEHERVVAALRDRAVRTDAESAPPVLELDGLHGDGFAPITLRLRASESIGVAGVRGSGKIELAETIAGLHAARGGTVRVCGRTPQPSVRGALNSGVGFVPRDRHREGLVLGLSIEENATMTIDDLLGRYGWIAPRRRRAAGAAAIERFGIVAREVSQLVGELSGGNQQKVVFARAVAREPKVLVAIDPTAGVDVSSKQALHDAIKRLRAAGTAVVLVSDDLDDLRECDRVIVLFEGRVVAELPAGWRDNELIAKIEGLAVA